MYLPIVVLPPTLMFSQGKTPDGSIVFESKELAGRDISDFFVGIIRQDFDLQNASTLHYTFTLRVPIGEENWPLNTGDYDVFLARGTYSNFIYLTSSPV